MTAVIEAANLSAGYHGRAVIENIDIFLEAGQIAALVGANGAGKTTTLMTLAGELQPMTGTLSFLGSSRKESLNKRAARGLAYVTEERAICKQLTTSENLRIGRVDRADVVALFPELAVLMDRPAGLLSGGEQQMLTLGRALARNPSLLLADELSLGLAPMVVTRLLSAVRAAADRGLAVILVEQHVAQAMKYADIVLVMRRGKVVARGTPAEVEPHLRQAYLSGA